MAFLPISEKKKFPIVIMVRDFDQYNAHLPYYFLKLFVLAN